MGRFAPNDLSNIEVNMAKLKVLIADDSVVYRTQIRSALEGLSSVDVVGTASNGLIALERIAQLKPD